MALAKEHKLSSERTPFIFVQAFNLSCVKKANNVDQCCFLSCAKREKVGKEGKGRRGSNHAQILPLENESNPS